MWPKSQAHMSSPVMRHGVASHELISARLTPSLRLLCTMDESSATWTMSNDAARPTRTIRKTFCRRVFAAGIPVAAAKSWHRAAGLRLLLLLLSGCSGSAEEFSGSLRASPSWTGIVEVCDGGG